MNSEIVSRSFIRLIGQLGDDFSLSQGLGGNCSFKFQGRMLVKSSGKRMSSALDKDFFHEVRLTGAGTFVDDLRNNDTKPSIEVFLHALIPLKYVIHLHCTHVISVTARKDFDSGSKSRNSRYIVLDYVRPGVNLRDEIARINMDDAPKVLLLKNHGIVVAADTVKDLTQSLKELNRDFRGLPATKRSLLDVVNELLSHGESAFEKICWHAQNNWRITPDHVVFLGTTPPQYFLMSRKLRALLSRIQEKLRHFGVLDPIEEQIVWFAFFASVTPKEILNTISEQEANELASWEAEKFRLLQANRINT